MGWVRPQLRCGWQVALSKEGEDPGRRDGSHAVYTPINLHLCPFHFRGGQGWRQP